MRGELLSAVAALAPLLVIEFAAAQSLTLREGFEGAIPERWALWPCLRPENRFLRDTASVSGTFSARLELIPPTVAPFARPPRYCLNGAPDADYVDDGSERAELWTRPESRLDVKAEAWYGFSMRIDGPIGADEPRLVIGQWKQAGSSGSSSPIIAQRFKRRNFHITIEQDSANGKACRVLVASQRGLPPPVEDIGEHKFLLFEDRDTKTAMPPCRQDIRFEADGTSEAPATLPDPFQPCWIDMVFHMARFGTSDALLEIWANGKKIVKVTGRMGYLASGKRYFKFGLYRDKEPVRTAPVLVHIDNFSRGASFAEVDPAIIPGRNRSALCR